MVPPHKGSVNSSDGDGNNSYVVNWHSNGKEIKEYIAFRYPYLKGNWEWVAKNSDYYFRENIAWSLLASRRFSARYQPKGYIIGHKGPGVFCESSDDMVKLLGVLNSSAANALLNILAPAMAYEAGTLNLLPVPNLKNLSFSSILGPLAISVSNDTKREQSYNFTFPDHWRTGIQDFEAAQARLGALEHQIDDEMYRLYGISDQDRETIERELTSGKTREAGNEQDPEQEARGEREEDEDIEEGSALCYKALHDKEHAMRWTPDGVGIILGRFQPGAAGTLGNAICRREDFAVGSLPAPSEEEFDELVGGTEKFAYVDSDGARHAFRQKLKEAPRDCRQ